MRLAFFSLGMGKSSGFRSLSPDEVSKLRTVASYVHDRWQDAFSAAGGSNAVLHAMYVERLLLWPRATKKITLEGWAVKRRGLFNFHYFIDISPGGRVLDVYADEMDGSHAAIEALPAEDLMDIIESEIAFWMEFRVPEKPFLIASSRPDAVAVG